MSVLSNWPVSAWLMRKYVDSSIGQRTPFGMKQNEPSEKTAEFSAAKKLSLEGTTLPRYFVTRWGWILLRARFPVPHGVPEIGGPGARPAWRMRHRRGCRPS